MRLQLLFVTAVTLVLALSSVALGQSRGILGREAPAWNVDTWFQLPGGTTSIDVDDYRGKVVYLYCFQSWCPGCHSSGFPTLQELIRRFEGNEDVAFVAVQTTFEGFHANTAAKSLATAQRYGLTIPFGHSGSDGQRSRLMRDYRTGGTPWTVVIDRDGVVRYNAFHIKPDAGEQLIKRLLEKPSPAAAPIVTLPASRGGQDRIGQPFPRVTFDRWIGPSPTTRPEGTPKPRATLYRWWTDGCPHCEASLPAMERLRKKYGAAGLRVVGVYHPKPPRSVDDETVRAAARARGFQGTIAVDEDWSVLREAYLDGGERGATSICLLVDDEGVIRFVHPGPVLFPSAEPEDARANADYELLEDAVRTMLAAP